jgi:hypothetical protein
VPGEGGPRRQQMGKQDASHNVGLHRLPTRYIAQTCVFWTVSTGIVTASPSSPPCAAPTASTTTSAITSAISARPL